MENSKQSSNNADAADLSDRFRGLFSKELVAAVLLASVVGAFNWIAFEFQVAFLSHFNIPWYVVEVSLARTIFNTAMFVTFMLVFVVMFACVEPAMSKCCDRVLQLNWIQKNRTNRIVFLTALALVTTAITAPYLWYSTIPEVFLVTAWSGIAFILLKRRPVVRSSLRSNSSASVKLTLVAMVFGAICLPSFMGGMYAKLQSTFWVFEDGGSQFAIIAQQGEYSMVVPYDSTKSQLGPGYKQIKTENLKSVIVKISLPDPPKVIR